MIDWYGKYFLCHLIHEGLCQGRAIASGVKTRIYTGVKHGKITNNFHFLCLVENGLFDRIGANWSGRYVAVHAWLGCCIK